MMYTSSAPKKNQVLGKKKRKMQITALSNSIKNWKSHNKLVTVSALALEWWPHLGIRFR